VAYTNTVVMFIFCKILTKLGEPFLWNMYVDFSTLNNYLQQTSWNLKLPHTKPNLLL